MNRKRGDKTAEELEGMIKEAGGRPWLKKGKFPKDDLVAIDAFLKKEGGRGYMRLAAWASNRELKKKKPDLYFNLQKFLFEAGYPKKLIEGEISLPVKVTFELVKTPKELEKPSELAEGTVIELKEEDFKVYEGTGTEAADIADTITTD